MSNDLKERPSGLQDSDDELKLQNEERRKHQRRAEMDEMSQDDIDDQLAGIGAANGLNSDEQDEDENDNNDDNPEPSLAEREQNIETGDGNSSAVPEAEQPIKNNTTNNKPKAKSSAKSYIDRNKKALAASVVLGIATLGVGLVLIIPGLAIRTLVQNTQEYFFDKVTHTIEKRTNKYVQYYLLDMVGRSMDECGTYISADCNKFDPGVGRLGALYVIWSTNRVEEKWARDFGLTFEKEKGNPNIEVFKKTPTGRVSLGTFGRNTASREVLKATESITQSLNIRDRRQIRGLLNKKYGVKKWCFIACGTRDNFADINFNLRKLLKARIALRIAGPLNERATAYVLCFIAGCSEADMDRLVREAGANAINVDEEKALRELAAKLDANKFTIGQQLADDMLKKILVKILGTKLGPVAGQTASKFIPVVGWIYAAAALAEFASVMDEKIDSKDLSKYLSNINEAAYADNFALWTSTNDDIISGEASYGEGAAMFSIIGGFDKSRIWQTMSGSDRLSTIECKNDVVLTGPEAPLACPEKAVRPTLAIEELWQNGHVSFGVDSMLSNYRCAPVTFLLEFIDVECLYPGSPRSVVKPTLGIIDSIFGAIGSTFYDALSYVPALEQILGKIEEWTKDLSVAFLEWAVTNFFTAAFNPDAEGAEAFDQYAAGSQLTAESYMKGNVEENGEFSGLGGKLLTDAESAELDVAIQKERAIELKSQSFFARYFDFDNVDSLASKVALAPLELIDLENATIVPPAPTFENFAELITPKAYAAEPLSASEREAIFGIPGYGVPVADLDTDPKKLTAERCTELAELRESESTYTINPETKEKGYNIVDLCLTDDAVVDMLTKKWDLDPLGTTAAGNVQIDLSVFLQNKRQDTSNVPCVPGFTSESIVSIGNGVNIRLCNYNGVQVNAAWSDAATKMIAAAKSDGITITGGGFRTTEEQIALRIKNGCPDIYTAPPSSCRIDTAIPGTSNHELGLAIDVNGINSSGMCQSQAVCPGNPIYDWLVTNASKFGIEKLKRENWHWSIDGG